MRFGVVIRIAFGVPLELEEGAEVEPGDKQARLMHGTQHRRTLSLLWSTNYE